MNYPLQLSHFAWVVCLLFILIISRDYLMAMFTTLHLPFKRQVRPVIKAMNEKKSKLDENTSKQLLLFHSGCVSSRLW